ncbi:TatA/E family twin arginine-targeting protein translocase [Synechococcus sp. UW105]|jgi:sec-independent protein translocase protein TatA|uniref:TatA/E family twin arginine-targeting protein translocase n=1 Tax=Synechococcus sp. UW105 TaxID=337067 RepID=UPI000E0EB1CE|nr:TatA/E family twin arginine-targeting protein translocase [Synechococcus sp. UW105]|tara:strand:- start:26 stop:322 length:297 start_codon:yes stop_codon:yes gene_type:complete
MNVFGVGLPEMAVIGAVALLVFGPKRLPELGRTLGKTLKGFQSASKEFEREINKAMAEPEVTASDASESSGETGLSQSQSSEDGADVVQSPLPPSSEG